MISPGRFLVYWLLCQVDAIYSSQQSKVHMFDTGFENGTFEPWIDLSEDGTCWVVSNTMQWRNGENSIHSQIPPLEDGKYFLQLENADVNVLFGVGKLSTATFLANPGDKLQFSYWISSRYSQFNNLQVSFVL